LGKRPGLSAGRVSATGSGLLEGELTEFQIRPERVWSLARQNKERRSLIRGHTNANLVNENRVFEFAFIFCLYWKLLG
jgi:hypothetical protein